jgi:hypothetical protein
MSLEKFCYIVTIMSDFEESIPKPENDDTIEGKSKEKTVSFEIVETKFINNESVDELIDLLNQSQLQLELQANFIEEFKNEFMDKLTNLKNCCVSHRNLQASALKKLKNNISVDEFNNIRDVFYPMLRQFNKYVGWLFDLLDNIPLEIEARAKSLIESNRNALDYMIDRCYSQLQANAITKLKNSKTKDDNTIEGESKKTTELSEKQTKFYRISANSKKATYQTEQWNNVLTNGKKICFEVTTFFRWGEFEIELNDKEKDEILKKESIILNDYGCSCIELSNSCDLHEEIVNEDKFDEEEKKEIHRLIYYNDENEKDYDCNAQYCLDIDTLKTNGWSMDETIYGISCGCVLLKGILVDCHVVTSFYGSFDTGRSYADEKVFEDKKEALNYYNEITLVTLQESKDKGGVRYKKMDSGTAYKLKDGTYDRFCIKKDCEEEDDEDL